MWAPVSVCHRASMLLSYWSTARAAACPLLTSWWPFERLTLDVCVRVVLLFAQLFSAVA